MLFKKKLRIQNYRIKFIVLLVDENTLLLRDKERPEDCQMKERCITLLKNFKNNNYNEKNNFIITSENMDKNTNEIEYTMTWRKSKINYKLLHKL